MVKCNQTNYINGFSVIEVVVALTVGALVLGSAIQLIAVNQSQIQKSEVGLDIVHYAHALLQDSLALAKEDFSSLTSRDGWNYQNYGFDRQVLDLGPCEKRITIKPVSIVNSPIVLNNEDIVTTVGDVSEAKKRRDTCTGQSFIGEDWKCIYGLGETSVGADQLITGIDVYGRFVYVTTISTTPGNSNFFIIDISNPKSPYIVSGLYVSSGANAVDVAGHYAFIANKEAVNQLLVVDIIDPLRPRLVPSAMRTLPGVSGIAPQGLSLYYYDAKIYIGTHRTAGREFHIYDVSNPENPVWQGSAEINHNVNQIIVRDQKILGTYRRFAFFAASGNAKDVMVYDVSDPTKIALVTTIDLLGDEDGKSIYILGNRLFVGRFGSTSSTHPGVYVIDIMNPQNGLQLESSAYIGKVDIASVVATNNFVFIASDLSDDQLQVWEVPSEAGPLTKWSKKLSQCNFNIQGFTNIGSLDIQEGLIYGGSRTSNKFFIISSLN